MLGPTTPSTSNWHTHGQRVLSRVRAKEHYRTCCNCCHIKTGTVFLGLLELVAVAVLFMTLVRQLMGKDKDLRQCLNRNWRECLNFNFSHSNITLAGDYAVLLSLFAISICIVLLFYGICNTSPRLLLPHLVVQLVGLLCSMGYFLLYAWSYFYGDLYIHKRHFQARQLIERLWLASILLLFSAFQCYLFITVLKCSLYLQKLKSEQRRRAMQYEEVSNRVRLAKQNGLWRETSWGGVFQEYRGQYDDEEKRKEKEERRKERAANRVQWDLQANREKSINSLIDDQAPKENVSSKRQSSPTRHEQPSPLELHEMEASPKRAAKLAKQNSKSSSQDSAPQRPSPPLISIPVERNVVPPPLAKRIKKEKSSDSLLSSGGRAAQPGPQHNTSTSNHHQSSSTTKRRGDSDSPPHRNRTGGHQHGSSSGQSPIRRTSVDSTAMGIYRPPPAAQNRLVQSTSSKYSSPGGSPYEQRKFRAQFGAFPTHAFEQHGNEADMKRSGDFVFKGRGMIGVQMPSTSSTPHVKKISITSKAPPSIPY